MFRKYGPLLLAVTALLLSLTSLIMTAVPPGSRARLHVSTWSEWERRGPTYVSLLAFLRSIEASCSLTTTDGSVRYYPETAQVALMCYDHIKANPPIPRQPGTPG